jgi:hypothetical protein
MNLSTAIPARAVKIEALASRRVRRCRATECAATEVDADRVLVIRASLATLILIALFFRRGCDPRLLAPRRSRARCFSRQRHHAQFRRAHRPHMPRYGARSALCRQELFAKGQALEHQTEEKLRDSKGYEHLHHILTVAVTPLHITIAIATIAIVVRGQRIT